MRSPLEEAFHTGIKGKEPLIEKGGGGFGNRDDLSKALLYEGDLLRVHGKLLFCWYGGQ
jgi:hypothetical protein